MAKFSKSTPLYYITLIALVFITVLSYSEEESGSNQSDFVPFKPARNVIRPSNPNAEFNALYSITQKILALEGEKGIQRISYDNKGRIVKYNLENNEEVRFFYMGEKDDQKVFIAYNNIRIIFERPDADEENNSSNNRPGQDWSYTIYARNDDGETVENNTNTNNVGPDDVNNIDTMGLDDIDPVARDPMFIKDAGDKNERHKDILVFRGRISAKTVKTIQSQVILDQEFFSNIKKTFADARAAKKDAYKTYMNKTTVNYSALSVKLAQNAKQLEKFNIKIENLTNLKAEHAQELKTRVEIDNVVADILALEKNSDPAVEQLNEAIKDDVEAIKEHSRVYMENMNNILNVSTERINDILEGVAVVCRETQDQMDAVVNISEN